MRQGKLVSFEGLDGAGKTTQIRLLEQWLETQNIAFLRTREPGGTPLGEEIRQLLLHRPDLHITPLSEAFLFQADRAQHFETVILPALADGILVITDRCLDSSIAYQGAGRNLGVDLIEQLSLLAMHNHMPDLTIFLDLAPEQVRVRTDLVHDQSGTREETSHFDRAAETFHQQLRQAFLTIAHKHPQRVKIVDASRSPEQVQRDIITLLTPLLKAL